MNCCPAGATVLYTGTLLHDAQARAKVIDAEGHAVPVLCLDLQLDNLHHTHMHIEQPFLTGRHTQAQATAHRLKRGMRISVEAPLAGVQLVATNAAHVHVIPEHATDLFQEAPL
jgi:hypothetical protein